MAESSQAPGGEVVPFPTRAVEGEIVARVPADAVERLAGPPAPARRVETPIEMAFRHPVLTHVLNRNWRLLWEHAAWRARSTRGVLPYVLLEAVVALTSPVRAVRGLRRALRGIARHHAATEYTELISQVDSPEKRYAVLMTRDAQRAERILFWLSPAAGVLLSIPMLTLAGLYWWARVFSLPGVIADTLVVIVAAAYMACAKGGRNRAVVTSAEMAQDSVVDTAAIVEACKAARMGDVRVLGAIAREEGLVWATVTTVQLPPGGVAKKEARKVAQVASALHRDRSEVSMEPLLGHAGQFSLWVADDNPFGPGVNAPRRPLKHAGRLSAWDPIEVAYTPRGRPVSVDLGGDFAGLLLGGAPGAGKSAAAVSLLGAVALDPTVELWLADGKGVDSRPLWEIAVDVTTADPEGLARQIGELRVEMDRRYAVMAEIDRGDGRRGIKKVDRQVAEQHGLNMIVLWVDELAMYTAGKGKDAIEEPLRDLVARCRGAAIRLLCATQKPDAKIVPSAIRDLISGRWALRCETPEASDTVLGRGKAGQGYDASMIEAGKANAGIGYVKDETGQPVYARSHFYSDDDFDDIADRAYQLRKAAGTLPTRDWPPLLLADALVCFGDQDKLHSEHVLARLAEAGHAFEDKEALAAALRPYQVTPDQVKVDGINRQGYRLEWIRQAIERGPGRP